MRSLWSGSISFGLVNIPVHLYSASEEHAITFDMLHKDDLSPIRYARICKADGKEIPYKDIVKGYEFQKGEYVVIDEEDFKRVHAHKLDTIEIVNFTEETSIDPIFFEKPYFLEPGKGAAKAYALLRESLRKAKKVAVVRFILRYREHIGILKPYSDAIMLDQLRFNTEIREIEELKLPSEAVNKKELEMALKLIDQLTEKFNPAAYKDSYTQELQEIIDQKVKGITPRKKGAVSAKPSKVHDIMALLKASLKEKPSPKISRIKKRA